LNDGVDRYKYATAHRINKIWQVQVCDGNENIKEIKEYHFNLTIEINKHKTNVEQL
jgi:hypothetical protein